MRKIIVFNFVSVDGHFADSKGEIEWHNYDDEMGAYSIEQLKSLSALLFGKTTYELMASYWPTADGIESEPEVAEIMNTLPKIVFSETLTEVEDGPVWKNVTVLHDIKPEEVLTLKEQAGGDIAIFGSGTIVQQLTNLGLIDEYRLVINPLILGDGKPLLRDIKHTRTLRLIRTRVFQNGNVLLCYQSPG